MDYFFGRSSKSSKAEGIPFNEIKWLQTSLEQGMKDLSLLECNSEALIKAVESQTYTTQKLQQELRSCNLHKVLIDKETQPEETNISGDTGCPGDGSCQENVDIQEYNSEALITADESQTYITQKLQQEKSILTDMVAQTKKSNNSGDTGYPGDDRRSNNGQQDHKQVADGAYQASDVYYGKTFNVVDLPSKQQALPKSTDDILVKLLLNNQDVLMNQAKVNQKAVQNSTEWLKNLQQQVGSWFSQNYESSLNEQDKKYKALEEEKNQLSENCKKIEEEKNNLNRKCKGLEVEKNQLSENCKKLEEGKKESQKEIEKLKKECDRLSTEMIYLKNTAKPSSYSGRLLYPSYNTVPQKKSVTTQVYCPRKSELTTNVVSELSATLQLQMSSYNLDLVIQMCETPSNISRSLPVIVICLNASRLGTDVSNALQGVPTGPNVAVLILHHKDIHALPTQSSDRVLTGSDYKNVGAIIDMAYLTNKGMYTCDMNNRALETLKDFIQTHSHP